VLEYQSLGQDSWSGLCCNLAQRLAGCQWQAVPMRCPLLLHLLSVPIVLVLGFETFDAVAASVSRTAQVRTAS
jgi:hypothetical protein